MLELLARPELRLYPMRLFSAARPLFARIFGILIFRKDLRIRSTYMIEADSVAGALNLSQPLLQLCLLGRDPFNQYRRHFFMQCPQIVYRPRSQTTTTNIHGSLPKITAPIWKFITLDNQPKPCTSPLNTSTYSSSIKARGRHRCDNIVAEFGDWNLPV